MEQQRSKYTVIQSRFTANKKLVYKYLFNSTVLQHFEVSAIFFRFSFVNIQLRN